MIAESLKIPKTVVLQFLKEDLGRKELIPKFPHQENVDNFSTLKAWCTKNSYQKGKQ
jgi:hypothetical protein